jgi:curved DNA-binding protein CbpA
VPDLPYHYATLGVPPEADEGVIRAAYRQRAFELHPDRNPGDSAAADRMVRLNKAYAVLTDPHQRALHDAQVASAGRHAEPPPRQQPTKPTGPASHSPQRPDDGELDRANYEWYVILWSFLIGPALMFLGEITPEFEGKGFLALLFGVVSLFLGGQWWTEWCRKRREFAAPPTDERQASPDPRDQRTERTDPRRPPTPDPPRTEQREPAGERRRHEAEVLRQEHERLRRDAEAAVERRRAQERDTSDARRPARRNTAANQGCY